MSRRNRKIEGVNVVFRNSSKDCQSDYQKFLMKIKELLPKNLDISGIDEGNNRFRQENEEKHSSYE